MKRTEEPVCWLDPRSDAPDDLRALLSGARDALGPSNEELTRLGAFAASAGTGGGVAGATGAGKAAATLKLGAILAVAVVGGGVGYSVLHTTSEAPPVQTAVAVSTSTPAAATVQAGDVLPAEPAVPPVVPAVPSARAGTVPLASPGAALPVTGPTPAAAPVAATPTVPAVVPASPVTVGGVEGWATSPSPPGESELALLDRARTRVGSDPAAALRALDEHRARFPSGTFVQEREVLAIEALVHLGRRPEAKARADAFARAFPTSAHRRRIAVLLGESAGE